VDRSDPNVWDIESAKAALPEVRVRANTYGPQILTIGGLAVAAVVSILDLRRLQNVEPTLKDLLVSMPSLEGVDLTRDRTPARDIEL
jgi:hypothetical protein